MTLMQNTLKHKMPFSNHVLITSTYMSKSKKANFSVKILTIFAPVSSTFTIACNFFHPAGDVTKVFVVPRKVTGKEWVAGMPG